MKKRFDFHADDYALTEHASRDIIQLIRHGNADSISILPNMSCFGTAMEMLNEEVLGCGYELPVSVHLNFMEGHCVSDASGVPDLVSAQGYFTADWGGLCRASFDPVRQPVIRRQLALEMKAQIDRVRDALPAGTPLRIDSHQHTHMIPVVREALMETIRSEGYPVTFIRNSHEPLGPFLSQPELYRTYEPVNLAKNRAISAFAGRLEWELREMELPKTYLCGLMLSGHMDEARLKMLLPVLKHFTEEQDATMEILFHPGRALADEIGMEFTKPGFVDFHLSKNRKVEGKALIALTSAKNL